MAGSDDDPREAGGIEQSLFLVEVPTPCLLGHQPALQAIGKPGYDPSEAGHLLVEIGPQPSQLIVVAQLMRRDHFIEASGEWLVVGDRLVGPVAAKGVGAGLVGAILGAGGLAFLGIGLAVGTFVLALVALGLLRAHFHVAAAVGFLGFGVVSLVRPFFLPLPIVTTFVRVLIAGLLDRQLAFLQINVQDLSVITVGHDVLLRVDFSTLYKRVALITT